MQINNDQIINELNTIEQRVIPYLLDAQKLVNNMAKRKTQGYCPFLPLAIAKSTVWYEVIEEYTFEKINMLFETKVQQFKTLPPQDKDYKKYKTLILIFPGIPFRPAQELLDFIQEELKHYIIDHKIVIGGFSSNHEQNTLYLILRHLVEQDLSFLLKTTNQKEKITYLENYLRVFHKTLTEQQYAIAQKELDLAKKNQTIKP